MRIFYLCVCVFSSLLLYFLSCMGHSLTPPLVVPKPREIRQWEKEKRKRDRGFFQDMEENILASLQRNERIPGISSSSSSSPSSVLSANDLSSPSANLQQQQPISHDEKDTMLTFHKDTNTEDDNDKANMSATTRPKGGIRTISGMDERTLADLYNSAVAGHSHKNDQEMKKKMMMMTKKKDYEGRDDERPLVVKDIINHHLMQKQPQQLSLRPPLPPRGQQQQRQEDMDVAAAATKAHDLNTAQVSSTYSSKDGSSTSNNSVSSNDQDMNNNTMSHIRHHSESASYTSPTMINPNVAATIQSVCGVCRVHLVEHWQQAQQARQDRPHTPASCFPYTPLSWSMMKATTNAAVVGLFRDDDSYYNTSTSHQQYRGENASRPAVAAANNNNNKPVPSIEEMVRFYSDFYETSKMQQDTIIMSLIYLERLMKYTNGALVPTPENWRSLLLSCMTLASKVWDDLSMWNVDFSFVAASTSASGLANFSLQRINRLEVALLSSLMFDVRVTASEYAKYYFLIRTMMIRSTQSSSSSSSHETATAMGKTKTTSPEHKRSSSTATAPAKQYHPDHPPLKKSREHYKSEASTRIPPTAAAPSKSRRWTEDFWVSVPTAVTNTSTATTTAAAAAAAMDCFTPSYSSRRSMASVLAH